MATIATIATSLLDAETVSVSSQHDPLGRVLTAVSPDGSEIHYSDDETEQIVVGDITYEAKGRREKGGPRLEADHDDELHLRPEFAALARHNP